MNAWINNLEVLLERWPTLASEHVLVTVVSLGLGVLIALPLGIWTVRRPRWRAAATGVASVVQTVPALALLALILPVLVGINALLMWLLGLTDGPLRAIGFLPTVIALTLYSLLPMLRNTLAGLAGVDPATVEAARGVGMTRRQVLWRVQMPLALPVIVAGVRTAAVWTVGMATLSTLIGQPSLGDYIITGLQTRNTLSILLGVVSAAALAIALDQLLGLMEAGVAQRSAWRKAVAAPGLALIVLAGFTPITIAPWLDADRDRPDAEIGAKTFNESYILAHLIADELQSDFDVHQRVGLGSTVAYDALRVNELDAYVDYTGTIWATIMKRDQIAPADVVLREMTQWLKEHDGIVCLGSLGFQNAYALAVRKETAEQHGLKTISDLAKVSDQMSIASDPEFFGRAEWRDLVSTYGLDFQQKVPMQSTLMYEAIAAGEVDVITAYTSDGRITAYDLVTLTDDRHVLPPYEAVLLLSPEAAANPKLTALLQPLIGAIDIDEMRRANLMVDIDGDTVATAAAWLRDQIDKNKKTD